jgi:hypothetical protein
VRGEAAVVDEHKAGDTLGSLQRQPAGCVAAHRVADDHGVAQVQSIGEFDKQIPEFDGAQRRGR